jgi:hypothetical protein
LHPGGPVRYDYATALYPSPNFCYIEKVMPFFCLDGIPITVLLTIIADLYGVKEGKKLISYFN